ncbi:MAG: STT3 domain-containing protein [Candidatus Hermodarchaeota archaeon]
MPKISTSIRNLGDRIRASVSVKSQNIIFSIALILVIVLAIMIRLTPILRGPLLIKAFDPWIQYYNAKYISEHSLYEYFHWKDTKSWYPEGRQRATLRPGLPFTAVAIYHMLNFIGIPVSIYEVCFYFPVFMGGFTVLAAYYLGKEVYDRSCGLFTAFFLAFNIGHMQRTMAGFFDNETIGVFAVLMTLIFFLKTVKTGRILHSVIGGIFLGYLSLSWGGYQFVFYILPLVVIILILLNKYNENVLIAYSGVIGTGLLIFSLWYNFAHSGIVSEPSPGAIFLFTVIIVIYHMIFVKRKDYPKFYNTLMTTLKWVFIPIAIVVAVIIWVNPDLIPLSLSGRFKSILSPLLREDLHIVASVAEHMPSPWSIFYYNILIPLLLLPLGIFFCFKRLQAADILMVIFLLSLFYFTGSMIRIILLFAPAASLVGAYGLVNVLKIFGSYAGKERITPSRKRRRQLRRQTIGNSEIFTVYFLVGVLCLAQVLHATDVSLNQLSYSQMAVGGDFHDWEETLTWMKNNLDGDEVVASWWDYGYWLTPVGNVTTVNDNDTGNSRVIGMVGMAFMQTNEIYSAKVFRELQADYVLVYFGFLIPGFGGDEGKWPWMVRICNDNYEKYKDAGLEEDNWAKDSVFLESDYINDTSGLYEDAWFDSQLARLMFYGEETSPSGIDPNEQYPRWYYASQIDGNPSYGISARETDDGDEWNELIPNDGEYDFKIFKEAYVSEHGLVKLFKIDYTALDSSFEIENEKVYESDEVAFNLRNTGSKDITIKNVLVNGREYNYSLGVVNNELKVGETIPVWIDIDDVDYELFDVVNISVTAQSVDADGDLFTFTEGTKEFFVSEIEKGNIQINKEQSSAKTKNDGSSTDLYLEIENTGSKIEHIKNVYIDTEDNLVNMNNSEYLSGGSVLNPGYKAYVKLPNAPSDFYTNDGELKGHLIGVETSSGAIDEVLLSYETEGYKISILSTERLLSPENQAVNNGTYRAYIPADFENIDTYAYYNGSIRIRVNNAGENTLSLGSVCVAKAEDVKYGNVYNLTSPENFIISDDWDTLTPGLDVYPGQQKTILINASQFDINEEIVVGVAAVTSSVPIVAATDIGLLNTINNEKDFKIVETINNNALTTSFILANETGQLLIKNIGDESLKLKNLYLNSTAVLSFDTDINYLYGDDSNLGVQECVLVSFDYSSTGLKVNKSDYVNVTIDTYNDISYTKFITARVHAPGMQNYYDIKIIDNPDFITDYLSIDVQNLGSQTLTIDSVYLNGTYVPADEFDQSNMNILKGNTLELTIQKANLDLYIVVNEGDKLDILVRTVQGAEYLKQDEIV